MPVKRLEIGFKGIGDCSLLVSFEGEYGRRGLTVWSCWVCGCGGGVWGLRDWGCSNVAKIK